MHYAQDTIEKYNDFSAILSEIIQEYGIDFVAERTKGLSKDEILLVAERGSINRVLLGSEVQYKEPILKFKSVFKEDLGKLDREDSKKIYSDLLEALIPDSLKQLNKEIKAYKNGISETTGKPRTWDEVEKDVNEGNTGKQLNRQALYFYRKGLHYPNQESLQKLTNIVSQNTINNVIKTLYGIDIETVAVYDAGVNELIKIIKPLTDEEKQLVVIMAINSFSDRTFANKTLEQARSLIGA